MKSLYTLILVLSLTFASCDNSTDNKSTKKSSSSSTQTTEEKNGGGETSQAKTVYRFAFAIKDEDHKVAYIAGGSYTWEVVEENKPKSDTRTIAYSSSHDAIATVENTGVVTFKTQGTVIITASKEADVTHEEVSDTYTLYITIRPANKQALVTEIDRAMKAQGNDVDLNYIDTSAITDMSNLFMADKTHGHGLGAFEGDISKWNVSRVTNMDAMFSGATKFNSNISGWQVNNVTRMVSMFQSATVFNQDISRWNVSNVTNMNYMFYGATAFNSDISGWNVSAVTSMHGIFGDATSFKQNLNAWGDRINTRIKELNWVNALWMFRNSGLARNLPDWCDTVPACKNKQQ